jgi:hypothetical protein
MSIAAINRLLVTAIFSRSCAHAAAYIEIAPSALIVDPAKKLSAALMGVE